VYGPPGRVGPKYLPGRARPAAPVLAVRPPGGTTQGLLGQPPPTKIDTVSDRDPEAAGKVVSRRGVHLSKPIFAGTRIPVATVQRYLQAGYDTKAIIREYPSLTRADIETARHYAAAG